MFCTNCGTSNKDDEKICIHCGESLAETEIKKKPLNERMLKKAYFLQILFDFSFNHFVTMKMTQSVYVLSVFYAGLLAVLCIVVGFSISKVFGIFMLVIGSPIVFLLTLVYSRILLETAIVVSRMAAYTAEIAKKADSKDGIQWNI